MGDLESGLTLSRSLSNCNSVSDPGGQTRKDRSGRLTYLLFFLIVVLTPVWSSQARATGAEEPTQLIVKLKADSPEAQSRILSNSNAKIVKSLDSDSRYKLIKAKSPEQLEVIEEQLRGESGVEFVEPNVEAHALYNPNDPYYRGGKQWNFAQVNAGKAWNIASKPGRGVIVALLDTGVAYENYGIFRQIPDLSETEFVPGYDFVNFDSHANDDNGHGSHVAGIVAQSTNNAYGAAGLAFKAKVMPVKVLDEYGIGNAFSIAAGIRWAADHGAKVINLSLATSGRSQTVEDAINYAKNRKKVTIVAASGNDGVDRVSYPAAYSSVISVGATNKKKVRASYSQYGKGLDLVAPGGDRTAGILQQTISMDPVDTARHSFYYMWGTSAAAPHVAAAAAILISKGVTEPSDIVQVLTKTAQDLGATGYDTKYGFGLLDIQAALKYRPMSTTWYFAEGRTANVFYTKILIGNSSNRTAQIRATFIKSSGEKIVKRYNVRAGHRYTINANSITALKSTGFSTKIESINGVGIVAERSTRFRYHGKSGGHSSIGAPSVSRFWYFAEGNNRGDFETILSVYNPSSRVGEFKATYAGPNGGTIVRTYQIGAESRKKIITNNIPFLSSRKFATKIESTNGVGLVAEREMYFDYKGIEGGHSTIGTSPSKRWLFAAGRTAGKVSTRIVVSNPSGKKVSLRAEFYPTGGERIIKRYVIGPRRRREILVDGIRSLQESRMSIKLESNRAVVAERIMYFRLGKERGGHATVGAKRPLPTWYIAEGETGPRSNAAIYIFNPGSKPAQIVARFLKPKGSAITKKLDLAGKSRRVIHVDAIRGLKDTEFSA
ncbi:MAG: peptidase S8, partial [Actinomycetia bacterium]|nr:peptidase S8 [Actinomycetes bacterium]